MDSNHNQNMNSGLTRYRSAPSSYFSNLINTGMYEDEQDNHPLFTPQTEHILSNLDQIRANESHFMDSMKQEQVTFSSQSQSQQQQMMYQNPDQYQKVVVNNNSVETNLLRQSSSPAGFFQQNNMDNGYSMIRSMENFRHVNGSVTDSSAEKRLKNRMASHSSTRLLSRIPENEGKVMAHNNGGYLSSFKGGSWSELGMLNDEFMKEYGENDQIISSENQNDEGRVHVSTGLTHQLSLSTSSKELFVMENLMQFQDSVPLRSRAKRGCATHPRSIAERVRRTRISERIRRLQDLVPNMDKQTNTADMLDLAVDYIKKLQKQTLSDHHSKGRCPHTQKLT